MTVVRMAAAVLVPWVAHRDPNCVWIAECIPLGLTVEADTFGELNQAIDQSLNLLMVDLLATGELDGFLKNKGWTVLGRLAKDLPRKKVRFDIPFTVEIDERAAAPAGCS